MPRSTAESAGWPLRLNIPAIPHSSQDMFFRGGRFSVECSFYDVFMVRMKTSSLYFAWRGYILAVLLGLLAVARLRVGAPLLWEFLFWAAAGAALRFWAGAYLGPHGNAMRVQSPSLRRQGP